MICNEKNKATMPWGCFLNDYQCCVVRLGTRNFLYLRHEGNDAIRVLMLGTCK